MATAPARRADIASHTVSPISAQSAIGNSRRVAAAVTMSGDGLLLAMSSAPTVRSTSLRQTTPLDFSAAARCSRLLLVASATRRPRARADQLARVREHRDRLPCGELEVGFALRASQRVSIAAFDVLAEHVSDQVIAAFADLHPDPLGRDHEAELSHGGVPRGDVKRVRVDQRSIQVEEQGA